MLPDDGRRSRESVRGTMPEGGPPVNVFDQATRFAARLDAEAVPRRLLAGTGLSLTFRDWYDTRSLPLPGGTDRTADLVPALDDPAAPQRPWLMVIEFQSEHDAEKLEVTL